MTERAPVRSAADVDETALSYAELKALATGNPLIKERMDLEVEVSRLKLLKSSHLSQRYALEDKANKELPQRESRLKSRIGGLEADLKIAESRCIHSHKLDFIFNAVLLSIFFCFFKHLFTIIDRFLFSFS